MVADHQEVVLSFQQTNLVDPPTWVGLDSFRTVVDDPAFGQAWRNTLAFTLLALLCGYVVPFAVAIVLNELRHARGYLRFVVYLPVMLPPIVSVLLFAGSTARAPDCSTRSSTSSACRPSPGSTPPTPRSSPSSSSPPG